MELYFTKSFLKNKNNIKKLKPLSVCFSLDERVFRDPLYLQRVIQKSPLLYKATGLSRGCQKILDLTMGWGEDALRLLQMGGYVIGVERSPIMFALLKNAYERCHHLELKERLSIVNGDAFSYLSKLEEDLRPQVIYMDPMFESKKSMSSSKMQALQWILEETDDENIKSLAQKAWGVCKVRLVIKRPLKSKPLLEGVTHSFKGRSIRYDLYAK